MRYFCLLFVLSVQLFAQAPAPFNLKTPSNGQSTSEIPVFSWSGSLRATYYSIFIDSTLYKNNVTDSSLIIQTAIPPGKHTWFVKAFNDTGSFQTSSEWVFFVDNNPPDTFGLVSPNDGQILASASPVFSWRATVDSGGAFIKNYQLWLNNVLFQDSITTAGNDSVISIMPGKNLAQGAYTWFVKALDDVGNSRSSAVRTFILDWEPPLPFTMTSPSDSDTVKVRRPAFSWHRATDLGSGIKSYELHINSQIVKTNAPDTSVSITFDLPDGIYSCYVTAYDNAGYFTNSDTITILVAIPVPPPAPQLSFPANLSNNVIENLSVNLSWGATKKTDRYHVQVASDSNFTNLVTTDSTVTVNMCSATLASYIKYYWRVRAHGSNGLWSDWSVKYCFYITPSNHRVFVPGRSQSEYLNDFISGDTLTPGVRRDSSAIYVLYRDSLYLSNKMLQNIGYKLTIVAQDGIGKRPYICLYPPAGSKIPPNNFIYAKGDVNVKNLVISGVYEYGTYVSGDTSFVTGMQGSLFDFSGSGFSLTMDSCVLSNTNGNHIRASYSPKNIKVTNTIFANMGFLVRSTLVAGKGIDVRSGAVDSLFLQNNTFVNTQDRIVRHYGSTAPIKYFFFDHNTIVNSMSFDGMLSLGKVNTCTITNNLSVDGFALGNDTNYVRQIEFSDSRELDKLGNPRMTWIIAEQDSGRTTSYSVHHNYYAVSDSGQGFYDQYSSAGVMDEGSPLTWYINRKLGADSLNAFKKITVELKNTPKLMTAMMRWYRTPFAQGGGGKSKDVTNFVMSKHDYDRRRLEYFDDTLDCSYASTSSAYSGAEMRYPAGDLNWFPALKNNWMVTEEVLEGIKATSFVLYQNFPNPFNPKTEIRYSLPNRTTVKLEIYDLLGAKISTLVDQVQEAGAYKVHFDGTKLSSGMYIYKLSTSHNVVSKKMLLLK